jgi:hypothetical protein
LLICFHSFLNRVRFAAPKFGRGKFADFRQIAHHDDTVPSVSTHIIFSFRNRYRCQRRPLYASRTKKQWI